ncbi:ion transporter [Nitrincola sp. A-D6]|uniref:ion transporter n=1 Tax=Nitrincola sp. A-D6 TaxID=1545442 RepID=UPI001F1C0470|nr:ion transporter [Nitrincola sp. A-D6]
MDQIIKQSFRYQVYEQLDPTAKANGLSRVNKVIIVMIFVAVIVAILETESTVRDLSPGLFIYAEWLFAALFSVEYIFRVYAAGEREEYRGFTGRIRYIFSYWSIIDLLAILPIILTFGSYNGFLLRLFRILRLLRLARIGRFTRLSMRLLKRCAQGHMNSRLACVQQYFYCYFPEPVYIFWRDHLNLTILAAFHERCGGA